MKNISKKLLAFLLAFVLLLGSTANVFATKENKASDLKISVKETDQTEEEARSSIEAYRKQVAKTKGLSNDQIAEEKLRVVVEVDGQPLISQAIASGKKVSELNQNILKSQESKLLAKQAVVQEAMKASGINSKPLNEMTTVFNGFSAEVKFADIEKIKGLDGVKDVFISNEYERPTMVTSLDQVAARQAWDLGYTGQGQILAVVDSGIDPSHKDFVMTKGVDLALTKDEVNGIINKEALPGKYYSDKVVYAYNYYDLNDNVKDIGGSQHGQHVAGTMAANGDEKNGGIKGVAPDAQLLGMKVFSSDIRYSTTFSDIYVKAIDDAIKLGADSINLSLGSPAGFYNEEGLEQKVLEKAQESGIVTTISAGNERNIVNGWTPAAAMGENPDTGLVGSPSANKAAFSIAAFENTNLRVAAASLKPEHTEGFVISLTEAGGAPKTATLANEEGYDYILVGKGSKEEFDKAGEEVKGKVAVAVRGNSFADTIKNGNAAGAVAVLVYNHEAGGESTVNMAGGEGSAIPFAFLKRSAGLELEAAKKAEPSTKIVFRKDLVSVDNPDADKMADFSSWGPTPDLQLKPEITASGGNIYSTQNNNEYTTMSGTSMSSPHVAGGIGVVKEFVNEKMKEGVLPAMEKSELSEFVQLLLMNTADVKADPKYPGQIYSPRQQGAGMMNLYKATTNLVTATDANASSTSFGEGKLELGQVGDRLSRKIKLTNYGDKDVTITPKVTLLQEEIITQEIIDELKGQGYTAEIIEKALGKVGSLQEASMIIEEKVLDPVSLVAGESKEITIPFDFSKSRTRDFVEGFVTLEKDDKQTLSVPFLGFKGNWDEPRVVDTFDATNLLDDPSNADDTIRIANPSQESQFKSSGFYQSGRFGGGLIANPNKVVLSPNNYVYNLLLGSGSATPIVSQLRNAKDTKYQVLSEDGKVLRTIFKTNDTRKIYRLYAGNNPFSLVANAKWDGKLDGKIASEGAYKYRIESTIDYKNARPQYDDFNFIVDDTKPVFVNGEDGKPAYKYDKESGILTFRGHDVIPEGLNVDKIAGLRNASIYNPETKETKYELVKDHKLIDKDKNLYEFTINVKDYLQTGVNSLEIKLIDEAWNTSKQTIVLGEDQVTVNDETPANIFLEKPELLEFYGGDPSKESYPVPVKGYVWGWKGLDSITIDGNPVKFTAGDIEVEDPASGISYKGPGFTFDTTVEFPEGYHEARVEVKKKGYTDFSIARRFWVDLTPPTVEGYTSHKTKFDSMELSFKVADNFSFIIVEKNGNLLLNKDASDKVGFAGSAEATVTDRVEGLVDGINKVTYIVADSLYEVEHTVYIVKGDLNIDELVAAIEDGEAINGLHYQPSLDALKEAIKEGKAVLDKVNPSQEEVDQAAKKIRDTIAALTGPASKEQKDELQKLVDKAEGLNKDLVTDKTLQPLLEALEAAKEVLKNPEATEEEVYKASLALQKALDGVEYKKVAPVVEATDKEVFVGDQFDPKSVFTAKDKFGNDLDFEVTGEIDVNKVGEYTLKATAKADGLETSAEAVITVVANDKSELKNKLDELKALDQSLYSEETKSKLKEAIAEAEAVLSNENAAKAEISQAIAKLDAAKEGLVVETKPIEDKIPVIMPVDKTVGVGTNVDLRTLFNGQSPDGKVLIARVEGKVDTSKVGVYEVVGTVTHEGASAKAKAKLYVVENDKSGLIAAIELATKSDLTKYTNESVSILRNALAKAREVRTDINASIEDIIVSTRDLLDAVRGLTEKTDKPENPEEPEKPAQKIVSAYVSTTGVNVRDAKTSEVVAVANMGKYFKGSFEGDYFMTSLNGRDVKIYKSFIVAAKAETRYINGPANVRNDKLKKVGVVLPGKAIYSVRLGDYYRYWESGQGVRLVHNSLVSDKEVKSSAILHRITSDANVREDIGGKVVGVKKAGERVKGYKIGNYLVFEENGKTLSVWYGLTVSEGDVETVNVSATTSVNVRDAKTGNIIKVAKKGDHFSGTIVGKYLYTNVNGKEAKVYAQYVR